MTVGGCKHSLYILYMHNYDLQYVEVFSRFSPYSFLRFPIIIITTGIIIINNLLKPPSFVHGRATTVDLLFFFSSQIDKNDVNSVNLFRLDFVDPFRYEIPSLVTKLQPPPSPSLSSFFFSFSLFQTDTERLDVLPVTLCMWIAGASVGLEARIISLAYSIKKRLPASRFSARKRKGRSSLSLSMATLLSLFLFHLFEGLLLVDV